MTTPKTAPFLPRILLLAGLGWAVLGALASPALTQGPPPLPTTPNDFRAPGTQPLEMIHPIEPSTSCTGCHSHYDPNQEPWTRWVSSTKAQAVRDPVFQAALVIANQDAAHSGELCLRCHAPGGWLEGRATPADGSGLDPFLGDYDGVTCHACHRMVDPVYEPGASPLVDVRILGRLSTPIPPTPSNGQYIIDPIDLRRGPFDLGPTFFYHAWAESHFHGEALLCGVCHDASNPTLSKQLDGSYQLNPVDQPHPTSNKREQFPIERTFSEWEQGAFARGPIEMGGRFGGNLTAVGACQDCHMPDTTGTACQPVLGGAIRSDLPQHNFNGTNSWILRAVRSLYPDSETDLNATMVAAAEARVISMQQRAADLLAWNDQGQLAVRVVNQTGHKLPTGYPEGRRMWLNVQFLDGAGGTIAERGAYDSATAVLTTADTRVWEGKQGLDVTQAAATGRPQGPSFHFVLNNEMVKDNRIPPRGFTAAGFTLAQSAPVGASFEDEQYWDEVRFAPPPGAVSARVSLYHQTTTKEYAEFLRDENRTNTRGQVAYDQWVLHGRSQPVLKAQTTIDIASAACVAPIAYGLAKRTSSGSLPVLGFSGTPSASVNDLRLLVQGARPRSPAQLKSSPAMASVPFQGGTLLLGGPVTVVANFIHDLTGAASIAIPVTPGMAGSVRNYQVVFRDQPAAQPLGLTNALHVVFCP